MKVALPSIKLACLLGMTLVCLGIRGSVAVAQIQLDRFYPPVVAAGSESTIKAEGKFANWPVQVLSDRADITLTTGAESGQLTIQVQADAAPGIAWVRMHDAQSASSLTPIMIAQSPITTETEPNNELAQAATIALPATIAGRLEKSGDLDSYGFEVKTGQTLILAVTAHQHLRSPMDAVLQLVDQQGNVLMHADDDRGLDPQLVWQADRDAIVYARLFAFPETPTSTIGYAGSASFVYQLQATTAAFLDHSLPLVSPLSAEIKPQPIGWNLDANAVVQQSTATTWTPGVRHIDGALGWQWQGGLNSDANVVFETDSDNDVPSSTVPCVFSGHLSQPGQIDRVRLLVQASKRYRAVVHSRAYGFPVDSVLRVIDPTDDSELARNDDRSRDQYDAVVEFTAKQDGELELQVSDLVDGFGPRHAYSVEVREVSPQVELTLAADQVSVKAGETVEIPVAIQRSGGFDQPLQVAAKNLPAGVQAEPVTSEPKGDSSKAVKLKLVAEEGTTFSGPIEIVAKTEDGKEFVAVHQLRPQISIQQVWLTVAKSSE